MQQLSGAMVSIKEAKKEQQNLRGIFAVAEEGMAKQVQHGGGAVAARADEGSYQKKNQASKYAFVMMSYTAPGAAQDEIWGILPMAAAIRRLSRYPLVVLTNATLFPDGTDLCMGLGMLDVQILPAAHHQLSIGTPGVLAFCSDACWYRGEEDASWDKGKVWCPQNSTVNANDYNSRVPGFPILELPPQAALVAALPAQAQQPPPPQPWQGQQQQPPQPQP
mmetsp:Transcript_139214/g.444941  ORF Transcript_139214/g.444941 Transcript_139214/m.444941 type:complete len:221 (-) Transcript_139214:8-670(-)